MSYLKSCILCGYRTLLYMPINNRISRKETKRKRNEAWQNEITVGCNLKIKLGLLITKLEIYKNIYSYDLKKKRFFLNGGHKIRRLLVHINIKFIIINCLPKDSYIVDNEIS